MASYDHLRGSLLTGDIVLFQGREFISHLIRAWSRASQFFDGPGYPRWSHCGLIVVDHDYNDVLVWHSTSVGTIRDVESGTIRKGVQISYLSALVAIYDGLIAIRRLEIPKDRRAQLEHIVRKLRKEWRGRPYEQNRLELLRAALDMGGWSHNTENLSSIFCSELVAETLQRGGVIGKELPSNEFVPVDFGDQSNLPFPARPEEKLGP